MMIGATLVVALSPRAVNKAGDHKGRPYSGSPSDWLTRATRPADKKGPAEAEPNSLVDRTGKRPWSSGPPARGLNPRSNPDIDILGVAQE
jgi:hypothetical protein